ncbi:NADPH-dependent FMN reductase [Desulforhopalus singaporensis]|uniref:NAD(P)H-dependent FMN reductase n=1 Tax=Desulforhopalus singaporensis TaxID=91360 RepID=A0A1H0UP60_9BACT|nr:NADPH-dependent FMN reductase [Desulforhopalus singaporensis]SDP67686.1 NAD(P)H-dependent FMN reductase [Desulforhopalus singaporensis]
MMHELRRLPGKQILCKGRGMKIVGISGSLREGSYNRLLLRAAQGMVEEDDSLKIFDLQQVPFYNADADTEIKPQPVQLLIDAVAGADGLLFATPEYNYSIPGVLKNAIDWASRPAYKSVLANKPTAILSASVSPVGGARAQVHLRDIFSGTLTPVYPAPHYLLPSAPKAFDVDGQLVDKNVRDGLKRYLTGYLQWVSGLLESDG